jgi:hypothetical protein
LPARIGADSSARQSHTIIGFTIATIVFGSLSFIAAVFALYVDGISETGQGQGLENWGHIVVYVAWISLGLSLPFIVMAFSINPLVENAWSKRKKPESRGDFSKFSITGWL